MNSGDSKGWGVLSRLSMAALRSAEALDVNEVATLSEHLYTYNSVPATRDWLERIPDTTAVRRELGLNSVAGVSALLEERWVHVSETAKRGWLIWVRPDAGTELGGTGPDIKLYVSPAVDSLESVFSELVRVATFNRASCLKVGADVAGLLRPDKLVAYFSTMGDLVNAAHELDRRLGGAAAHGVPFTAEISGDGLLSWGLDPPTRRSAVGEVSRSWREWVCCRLAVALVETRTETEGTEPCWKAAIERLRAQGVHVEQWSPSPAFWRTALW
jgi:hypothetical protein